MLSHNTSVTDGQTTTYTNSSAVI